MDVPLWVWIVAVVGVLAVFAFDFVTHVRKPHEPSTKEATFWTLFYMGLSCLFMVGMGLVWGWGHGMQYITGYAMELSLSVDNLFVFLVIMTSFKVPKDAQQKALLLGILIALVLRMGFIIAGVAILENFSWVFYLFAAWLAFVAIRQAVDAFRDDDPEMPKWVGLVKKVIPTSEQYHEDKWTIQEHGQRKLTPLVLVVVSLGFTDLLFALDSIPAIFAVSQDAFTVFMANAFALMGLRQMYFLIRKLMDRLVFLDLGLAFILGFIAVKLMFHALHTNEVPFINGGEPVLWIPEIETWFSLVWIFGVLAIATIASLIYSARRSDDDEADDDRSDDGSAQDGDSGERVDGRAVRTAVDPSTGPAASPSGANGATSAGRA